MVGPCTNAGWWFALWEVGSTTARQQPPDLHPQGGVDDVPVANSSPTSCLLVSCWRVIRVGSRSRYGRARADPVAADHQRSVGRPGPVGSGGCGERFEAKVVAVGGVEPGGQRVGGEGDICEGDLAIALG